MMGLLGISLWSQAVGGGSAPSSSLGPYLRSVTSSGLLVYSIRRLVSDYNGPLVQLYNGTSTMDINPATGSDDPDFTASAYTTWAGSNGITVKKWYEQNGSGRDLPVTGGTVGFDVSQTFSGRVPWQFPTGAYGSYTAGSAIFNARSTSFIEVCSDRAIGDNSHAGFFRFLNSAANILGVYLAVNGTQYSYNDTDGAQQFSGSLAPRSNLSVIGTTSNSSGQTLYCRESTGTAAAVSQLAGPVDPTGATFEYGHAVLFGDKTATRSSLALILSLSALSDTDMTGLQADCRTIFSVPTATNFTSRLIFVGDSITDGIASTNNKNLLAQLTLNGTPEFFNQGSSGQPLSDEYADRSTWINPLFTSAYGAGKAIVVIAGGTNDLGAGTSASTLYATLTSFISALHTTGFKVAVATILPRADASWTGAMETQRTTYNSSVVGNAAGADLIIDVANTSTTMGALTAPNDTTLYSAADHLHPTTLGYSHLANDANQYSAKLNTLL